MPNCYSSSSFFPNGFFFGTKSPPPIPAVNAIKSAKAANTPTPGIKPSKMANKM